MKRLWITEIHPNGFCYEGLIMSYLISGYVQSNAMASARDLFGSQSNQVLVKDEVAFQAARSPYQDLYEASRRMDNGFNALTIGRNPFDASEQELDEELRTDDRLLPADA
ncbi:hypothetical protein IPC734_31205 [Pseudomonas aeruginosa]|nr:hypothetical protein AO990_15630 [Pseudomonas aeruginosa]RPW74143.1 hypothetical protein IPC734_31205 [Pseudomonas aeruginosa]HBP5394243.1 hypothetical protein [Pseudomonas aeruginosa]